MATPQNGLSNYSLSEIDDMYHASISEQFKIWERLEELQTRPLHHTAQISDLKKDLQDCKDWCKKIDSARELKK